jgi:large subunit ribosomal protein L29
MQASELRDFTTEELQHRLQETRRELFNLRQQWYAGSLIDKNAITVVRRDIARILTILRERELEAQREKGGAA